MLRSKNSEYRELERQLGYRFRNVALLERALTHRSYRFDNAELDVDNQRLEFLGDAVLGFVVADRLFQQYSGKAEGDMTTLRSRITSGRALAKIAGEIDLGRFLRVGKCEEQSGGRRRASILEDALEAIIGAAWLDGGQKAADKIFNKLFVPFIETLSDDVWADNPKGQLQELVQARWKIEPLYCVTATEGPPHNTVFTVKASIPGDKSALGTARSKRAAEMIAARKLLKKIN